MQLGKTFFDRFDRDQPEFSPVERFEALHRLLKRLGNSPRTWAWLLVRRIEFEHDIARGRENAPRDLALFFELGRSILLYKRKFEKKYASGYVWKDGPKYRIPEKLLKKEYTETPISIILPHR